MSNVAASLVVMLLGVLLGRPPAQAAEPGVLYDLGACSRVVQRACPECDEQEASLTGGFSLAPGLEDVEEPGGRTFLIEGLVLHSEGLEARGAGVLVIHGRHASFLGKLDMGHGPMLVGGNGFAEGPLPGSVHLPHLVIGGVRFEIHATPASRPDGDCDGVADGDDLCPKTPCGAVVSAGGCAVEQLCPCTELADGVPWRSHRQYVRCVIAVSRSLFMAGKLDANERLTVVKAAVRSLCGRSAFASLGDRLALR